MKIEIPDTDKVIFIFDKEEQAFLIREAKENDLSVGEMFEMILGMLFVGGYSNMIGKEI